MLEYEWGNAPPLMLAQDPDTAAHDQDLSRQNFFDHYSTQTQPFTDNLLPQPPSTATFSHHHHHQFSHNPPNFTSLYDPRAYGGASLPPPPPPPSMLTLDPGYLMVPKSEEICRPVDFTAARIGLNLGGRTYFSSDDDFVNRLYRRPRPGEPGSVNSPRCQAEGCNADLSHAKHYHRRHKVCEFHSKASTVIAAGLTQRFCQQCSRFHLLSEFDNGKRSCRRRLADHNRRRRKSSLNPNQENHKPPIENSRNPSSENNTARSPPSDSGAQSSSSVTVAISPPRMSLDSFRQRPFQAATASSTSSSSFFFSSA